MGYLGDPVVVDVVDVAEQQATSVLNGVGVSESNTAKVGQSFGKTAQVAWAARNKPMCAR